MQTFLTKRTASLVTNSSSRDCDFEIFFSIGIKNHCYCVDDIGCD